MSAKKDNEIVVGGPPRIDFLPPEIHQKKETRRAIRGLVVLIALAVAVCVAAYAGITTVAVASQLSLESEQARTADLLRQQGEYFEARQADAAVRATKDARLVGSAYEILWADYLAEIDTTVTASMSILALSVDSQSSIEGPQVAAGIFEADHIATLEVSAIAETEGEFAAWLDNLEALPGFGGHWLSSISLVEETGQYVGTVTLHVNSDALEKRFFEKTGEAAESGDDESASNGASDDEADAEGSN